MYTQNSKTSGLPLVDQRMTFIEQLSVEAAQVALDERSLEITYLPEPIGLIPTMGEWGLISLRLMFMIFGIVTIRQS